MDMTRSDRTPVLHVQAAQAAQLDNSLVLVDVDDGALTDPAYQAAILAKVQEAACGAFDDLSEQTSKTRLQTGDLLLIDNGRCLHALTAIHDPTGSARELRRTKIMRRIGRNDKDPPLPTVAERIKELEFHGYAVLPDFTLLDSEHLERTAYHDGRHGASALGGTFLGCRTDDAH
jgi:hypothetical protein